MDLHNVLGIIIILIFVILIWAITFVGLTKKIQTITSQIKGGNNKVDIPENVMSLIPKSKQIFEIVNNNFIRTETPESFVWWNYDNDHTIIVIYQNDLFELTENQYVYKKTLKTDCNLTILDVEINDDSTYTIYDGRYINNIDIKNNNYIDRMTKIEQFIKDINIDEKLFAIKKYDKLQDWKTVIDYVNKKDKSNSVILQNINNLSMNKYKLNKYNMNNINFMIKYVEKTKEFYLYLYGTFTDLIYCLKTLPKYNPYSLEHVGVKLNEGKLPNELYILFSSPMFEDLHLFKPRIQYNKDGYTNDNIKCIDKLMKNIIDNPMNYDGKIIEFSYAKDGWVPLYIKNITQTDTHEFAHSIVNILFSPVLISDDHYYAKKIPPSTLLTTWHETNHEIRKNILNKILTQIKVENMLDLMCGRGADIPYYMKHNITNIIGSDADKEALIQYCRRMRNVKNAKLKCNMIYKVLDTDNSDLISEIQNRNEYPKKGVDFVLINYAIHYICDSKKVGSKLVPEFGKIKELLRTIRSVIIDDGYFMFSFYDGERIFNDVIDNKIKLKNFTIEILDDYNVNMPLPSIDHTGYRLEPLVRQVYLDAIDFQLIDKYYPVELFKNELTKIDPNNMVLDYLKYICVCIYKVNKDVLNISGARNMIFSQHKINNADTPLSMYSIGRYLNVNEKTYGFNEPIEHQYKNFEEVKAEILKLDDLYLNNEYVKTNFKKLIALIHPFETIKCRIYIHSLKKTAYITNAFMKMTEFLHVLPQDKNFNMFDIASAPGMFIIAVQHYYKRKIDWEACSYIPEGKSSYLQDTYGLFENSPKKFHNVNLCVEEDIKKVIDRKKQYYLVTGDVGVGSEGNRLIENNHWDVQYGQAVMAINLCRTNGYVFLKMFTCITDESIYLLETIKKYFKELLICKPHTSRLTNTETYIVGIKRNTKKCIEPLTRPKEFMLSTKVDKNLYYMYYYNLALVKNRMVEWMLREKLDDSVKHTEEYENYTKHFKIIYDYLYSLTKR